MVHVIRKGETTTYDFTNGEQGNFEVFPELDGTVRGKKDRHEVRLGIVDLLKGPLKRVLGLSDRYHAILANLMALHEREVLDSMGREILLGRIADGAYRR